MAQQQTMEQKEQKNQEYNEYVKQVTPTHSLPANMIKAFITGGVICVVGQFILNLATNYLNLDKDTSGGWCSMILVLSSVVLTVQYLSLHCQLGRRRSAGAYYRVCQFRSGSSD